MSKAIITADWHCGVRGDSAIFHNIFIDWIENFLVPKIKEEKVNYLFILADLFDNQNAINTLTINITQDAFDYIISNCPELKIYIMMGNHDIYFRNKRDISSLRIIDNKHENIVIVKDITRIKDSGKEIVLSPWLINDEEVDDLFSKTADICMGHFEINGFDLLKGIKEKKGLEPAKFKKQFAKTFSGHFHIRQELNNIMYVGNPFQMDWKDFGNEKGLTLLDFKTLKTRFIPNDISPIFNKIYLTQIKNKTIKLTEEVAGNFVQLIIDDKCSEKLLIGLQELILSKNPRSFDIEGLYDDTLPNEIDDADLTKPLEYLLSYVSECEVPDSIDKDKLIKTINNIYTRVQSD